MTSLHPNMTARQLQLPLNGQLLFNPRSQVPRHLHLKVLASPPPPPKVAASLPPPTKVSAPLPPPPPVLPLIHQFPHEIHKYIENIIDVKPDDNCGYRSIAVLLGMGEESWPLTRQDLITELRQNRDDYVSVLSGDEWVDELTRSLYLENVGRCKPDKWMTMPNTGYVIANKYKVVVICLESRGSYTISLFGMHHQEIVIPTASFALGIYIVYDILYRYISRMRLQHLLHIDFGKLVEATKLGNERLYMHIACKIGS